MVDKKETTSQFLQNRIKILTCGEAFYLSIRVYSSRFGAEYHLYADPTFTSTK